MVEQPGETLRFRGSLPLALAPALTLLDAELLGLRSKLSRLNNLCATHQENGDIAERARGLLTELSRRCIAVEELVVQSSSCCSQLAGESTAVRWLEVGQDESVTYNTCPVSAKDVLDKWLWKAETDVTCAFVSGTLRDTTGFRYYRGEIGAPADTAEVVLPSAFDYSRSTLTVVRMSASPKPAEREQFIPELKSGLLRQINPNEGTLVLLTSWALLRELTDWFKTTFGTHGALIQGDKATHELVEEHKRRIDQRRGNVLVGVASLSEGLDLPGAYCEHVCICALPFAVPTSPVEQELNDRLGSRYFRERSLPAATTRLQQMVGRLVRKESDSGRVTVYDHRLASTGYGREMLRALPPFTRRDETETV